MRVPEPLPDTKLIRYATARDIVYHHFRAFDDEDFDPAELQCGFVDEKGEHHDVSFDWFVEVTEEQGCWGWVDKPTGTVHVWPGNATETELLTLIGHELGHIAAEPLLDEVADEERCDTYGMVAVKALEMVRELRASPA